MKIVFFDIETTGLSSTTESILEIAAIVIDSNFNTVDSYQSFINPGKPIPFMITKLTGISDSTVKNAHSENYVLNEFMTFIKKNNPDQVAGHNIKRFDLNWIKVKTGKYGIKNLLETLPIIDTLEFSKDIHKQGLLINYKGRTDAGNISFKLEYLVNHFGLDAQTHRAIDDVYQNIIVYRNLKQLEETVDYGF